MQRRDFLQFLGFSTVMMTMPKELLAMSKTPNHHSFPFLKPSREDKVELSEGLNYSILMKTGEAINAKERFGSNNDFIAFHSLSATSAILWVNHEYMMPVLINGNERSKENIDLEMKEVGGSLLELKKENNEWKVVKNSPYNRRLDANTKIPFAWNEKIKGDSFALGTMGNCAGGKTPWGTFLTCEENYDLFWGDRDSKGKEVGKNIFNWDKFYPRDPEHYGWVVEIEPLTGKSKKLISLGRCAHECAAVTKAKNGKVVAYTGDDHNDEHFYKFISDSNDSLEKGKLYVANLEKGEWVSLVLSEQPILQKHFKSQTEVQIYAREAAKLVGATPLARPEDIEFDPLTGNVLVTLTNNKPKGNFHGSILKVMETDNDPGSLTFKHDTFLAGGKELGFACPDNMVFDKAGNLWFTSDISGDNIEKGAYEGFGNNSLFVFLRSGPHQGKVYRIANAPVDAEFTGPCFDPDYKTLFLSVQHPGEFSESLDKLTSHWPDGGKPLSCVLTITGPLLDQIVSGK